MILGTCIHHCDKRAISLGLLLLHCFSSPINCRGWDLVPWLKTVPEMVAVGRLIALSALFYIIWNASLPMN